ncbi:hypothetical protein JW823_00710 [bacterium]|nr:hypothetical protein [candidate division CSSED10-310 bacterium]
MKLKNRADIWKQQKYNNSCAWDCFSMLLKTQGVETSSKELVGSSQVPYQLRLHPEENRLTAGMLVQDDEIVNLTIGKYALKLHSTRVSTIADYIELATETLLSGESFVTSLKRPDDLPGRHAVVFTGLADSIFLGLDPDCRLDRATDYHYSDVKDIVTLDLELEDFHQRVTGDNGYVPLLGVLVACDPLEVTSEMMKDVFSRSRVALDFFESATNELDFQNSKSMPVIYNVLKPALSDLRTAIEIRDEYQNRNSEIALFLKEFESEVLEFRKLTKNNELVPAKLTKKLSASLARSYNLLEKHLSYEMYRRNKALTNA